MNSPAPSGFTGDLPARPQPAPPGLELGERAFARIAALAHREAGLHLVPAKSAMVRTRLARRLRALGITSYDAYCDFLDAPGNDTEVAAMISALTTNVSSFFRESHHFDRLRDEVLPPLMAAAGGKQKLRIWSAGCSNGQEPYSIAMTLLEAGVAPGADVRILATDIDPVVVAHGRLGEYGDPMMHGMSESLRGRYFEPVSSRAEPTWRATAELKNLVAFRELNLLRDWPMHGPFDIVFCRNVVIYFDEETQRSLWRRFANILAPGGWLFLGHSERVSEDSFDLLQNRGITSYQRTGPGQPERNRQAP